MPYWTLHRFASERCGFGRKGITVRVADGDPGVEYQVDFGHLGMLTDADDRRRRKVHALIFTAVYSRHIPADPGGGDGRMSGGVGILRRAYSRC
ncbi:hypothetical protein ACX9NE_16705 [Mycobacterium sp. ML4]